MKRVLPWTLSLWILTCHGVDDASDLTVEGCGSLANAYGPFDYTHPVYRKQNLRIVEVAHFTIEVETLVSGKSGYLWEDLDYTLRAFPNHHRALRSMAMYQLKYPRPPDAQYRTAECYFDRALKLKVGDAEVYAIYGMYLHKKGEFAKALEKYQQAEKLKPKGSADRDYNIGLLYFDMKDYKRALAYAKKADDRQYAFDELRDKLKSVNEWPGK